MAASRTKEPPVELEIDDRVVRLTSPSRVYFSERGETKLDLANYYLSVGEGIVNALWERPCMLHRFPDGVDGERFIRSGCRRALRRGWRPSASTSRASTGTPTSSASPSSQA
jgi:DNA primase